LVIFLVLSYVAHVQTFPDSKTKQKTALFCYTCVSMSLPRGKLNRYGIIGTTAFQKTNKFSKTKR